MRVEDVRSGLGLGDVDKLVGGPGRLGGEVVREEGVEEECHDRADRVGRREQDPDACREGQRERV